MPRKVNGTIVETDREATQAEKSPNTFYILTVSLAALAVVAALLFWYFGVFEGIANRPKP